MEFTTLVSLKNYQNKINNFQQGEIIYLTEDKKYVMYDGQDFIDIPEKVKVDSESGVHMSLYDLNKTKESYLVQHFLCTLHSLDYTLENYPLTRHHH